MILYFSGTGNSSYVAKKIAKEVGDDVVNLFNRIRNGDFSEMQSSRPWVIVAPTYAWRIPRIVNDWLEKTKLSGNENIYFVMTCGGSIGNAGKYLAKLCRNKKMRYLGCAEIVMPENYIALYEAPSKEEALNIILQADEAIEATAALIKNSRRIDDPKVHLSDKLKSGLINRIYYPAIVHAKKFYATDACISCGKCAHVCPLNNVSLKDGKPTWGDRCTHCMACICRCPTEAIEYGSHSKGLTRYVCPKES